MKSLTHRLFSAFAVAGLLAVASHAAGLQEGHPDLKSIGPLAFGPDGVLFAADTNSAAIFAIATNDTAAGADVKRIAVDGINQKIAALLGTAPDQILINDMVVHPVSHAAYLAISRGRGPDAAPVLMRVTTAGKLEVVSLDQVKFAKAALPDAPSDKPVPAGGRGSNPRQESITDIAYVDGRVIVAGLANEEFSSTLRAVPYPFQTVGGGTTVEIYHGSHGRFETRAPVRTFVSFKVGQESRVLAAYTCTPLVEFAVNELTPGAKVRGRTIAELGNRNRPIDMIVYQKAGKSYLLLANSARGVMKISADNLGAPTNDSIQAPVQDTQHKDMTVETIADWKGIEHLDRLDNSYALVVAKTDSGALNLEARALP